MLLDLLILESLVVLATMFANVTVPVVPDPNYLQEIYPTASIPEQYLLQAPGAVTEPSSTNSDSGATQPMDLMTIVNMAVTGGLAFLLQKNKTTTDRRTYMAADTTAKLAQNDQSSDADGVKMTYALSCLADIIGKHHREDMETYQTNDGVSLWTYIENLNLDKNHNFRARYLDKPPVHLTGSQSKDKVVATLIDVQQSITPTPTVEAPNTTKSAQTTTRTNINKETNKEAAATATTTTTA